jgi:hypothetical protein
MANKVTVELDLSRVAEQVRLVSEAVARFEGELKDIIVESAMDDDSEADHKPSWDNAPEWAEWLACNLSGDWWWFAHKPQQNDINWLSSSGLALAATGWADCPSWRETLERRPLPPCECGGEVWVYDDSPGHCVECKDCFTMVMRPTESEARRAWRKLMG